MRGGRILHYDKNADDKKYVRRQMYTILDLDKCNILFNEIKLYIDFYMPIPDSWSQKKKEKYYHQVHCSKPDIDNLLKFYMDCMDGIFFEGDQNIYSVSARKFYTTEPKTAITLSELHLNQPTHAIDHAIDLPHEISELKKLGYLVDFDAL